MHHQMLEFLEIVIMCQSHISLYTFIVLTVRPFISRLNCFTFVILRVLNLYIYAGLSITTDMLKREGRAYLRWSK